MKTRAEARAWARDEVDKIVSEARDRFETELRAANLSDELVAQALETADERFLEDRVRALKVFETKFDQIFPPD